MIRRSILAAALFLSVPGAAATAEVYTDGRLTVDWRADGGGYAGTFTLDGKRFPAKGRDAGGNKVVGTFAAGGREFEFAATLDPATNVVTLVTGSTTYTLKPKAPDNPLDAPPAANPMDPKGPATSTGSADPKNLGTPTGPAATTPAAPAADKPGRGLPVPAGYTVINESEHGRGMRADRPPAKSVEAALRAGVADAAAAFDAPPKVLGAVRDERDPAAGMAMVEGTAGGKPVRGIVTCRADAERTRVTLVCVAAAAPADAWRALAVERTPVAAAAERVELRAVEFPDGSGSIGLPPGWTTQARSMLDPVQVDGPDGAKVMLGGNLMVNGTTGPLAQMYQQARQRAAQMGMAPPPPPGVFADFCPPEQATKLLVPKLAEMARQRGLPYNTLDEWTATQDVPPQLPGGKAQVMEYTYVRTENGRNARFRSVLRAESAPLQGGDWVFVFTEITAPAERFAELRPALVAVLNSPRPNDRVIAQLRGQRDAAARQQILQTGAESRARLNAQFEAGQARHRQQMASYDAHNHAWAVNQNLRARGNDDFIETIRGTRDVVDTQTGRRQTVDLWDAGRAAQQLNEATNDPGRFKEIPFRDDMDPLVR